MIDLSIIILNYRSRGLLKECLRALRLARPQLSVETIVVDNASGDGTPAMVQSEFPDVRLIASEKNLGYAGGNNLGLKAATGRNVMIMNPDIIVRDGSLETLVKYLDEHADVGLVGPKLLNPDGSVQYSCYRFHKVMTPIYRRTPLGQMSLGKKALGQFLMTDLDRKAHSEVDWLLGGAIVARRSAVEKVGLLDPRFFLYFDDVDWSRRFWEAGFKVVYVPRSEMVHFHKRESAEGEWWKIMTNRVGRAHLKSAVKYFLKYHGKPNPHA